MKKKLFKIIMTVVQLTFIALMIFFPEYWIYFFIPLALSVVIMSFTYRINVAKKMKRKTNEMDRSFKMKAIIETIKNHMQQDKELIKNDCESIVKQALEVINTYHTFEIIRQNENAAIDFLLFILIDLKSLLDYSSEDNKDSVYFTDCYKSSLESAFSGDNGTFIEDRLNSYAEAQKNARNTDYVTDMGIEFIYKDLSTNFVNKKTLKNEFYGLYLTVIDELYL